MKKSETNGTRKTGRGESDRERGENVRKIERKVKISRETCKKCWWKERERKEEINKG